MTSIIYREGFEVREFIELAQLVWPGDYQEESARTALARTINIGAWDGVKLVGSVRILTDGYFFATVPEILVAPTHQRRGIGEELMHHAVRLAPRNKIAFGAQPQSVGFFTRIGCQQTLTGFVASSTLRSQAGSSDAL